MEEHRKPILALEYVAPPIFFAAEPRTRSPLTLFNAIACGVIGISAAIFVAVSPWLSAAGRVEVVLVTASALPLSGWNAWKWIENHTCVVRITADGVEMDGLFWPWPRVARIGGKVDAFGDVTLVLHVRGIPLGRSLPTSSSLTSEGYHAIRAQLEAHFAAEGLDVAIDPTLIETSPP